MKIEEAIKNYQETRCEFSFNQIYYYIYNSRPNIIRSFSRKHKLDEHDVESMINNKILDITLRFEGDVEKFKNAVFHAIGRGCIDLVRNKAYRESKHTEVMREDDDGVLSEMYEILEVAPTTEKDAEIIELKKHDQRQLIAFLISKVDSKTAKSASTFISLGSYREAAKHLGTTDKTVKSRVRSIAKQYDANRFGSHTDYLTTATVSVG